MLVWSQQFRLKETFLGRIDSLIKQMIVFLKIFKFVRVFKKHHKSLYIDLGAHVGKTFRLFYWVCSTKRTHFHLFEPNPHCFDILRNKIDKLSGNIRLFKEAAYVSDGIIEFYGLGEDEGGKFSQGGSVLKNHNSHAYDAKKINSIKVKSIDFSVYLKEQLLNYDSIIIKMDIEGSEVPVLEDLIKKKLISNIDMLLVEFHGDYLNEKMKNEVLEKEKYIHEMLELSNVNFVKWH